MSSNREIATDCLQDSLHVLESLLQHDHRHHLSSCLPLSPPLFAPTKIRCLIGISSLCHPLTHFLLLSHSPLFSNTRLTQRESSLSSLLMISIHSLKETLKNTLGPCRICICV